MSTSAWLVWITAQSIVLVGVLAVAMLGVTGRLTRSNHPKRATTPAATRPGHHLHLTFRHRAAR